MSYALPGEVERVRRATTLVRRGTIAALFVWTSTGVVAAVAREPLTGFPGELWIVVTCAPLFVLLRCRRSLHRSPELVWHLRASAGFLGLGGMSLGVWAALPIGAVTLLLTVPRLRRGLARERRRPTP